MMDGLREQVVRYLDGTASASERSALECALVEDVMVAHVFAEELLLRDLLRHAPPEVPPAEVVARWEAALLGELDATQEDAPGWWSSAIEAFGWSMRGPAMSFGATGPARAGLSTLRFGLPTRAERPAWWRRLLPGGSE